MPITVGHSAGVDPLIANLTYEGEHSRGTRQRRVENRDHALRQQQLAERRRQFNRELSYRGDQAATNRQHAVDMQGTAHENRVDEMHEMAEIGTQDAEFKNRQEQGLITYRYSAAQKAQFAMLDEALRKAEESGYFSPNEMVEVRRRTRQQQLGIRPGAMLRDADGWAEGQGPGRTWKSEDGSLWLTGSEDAQGNRSIKKLGDVDKTTNRDIIDAWKIAIDANTGLESNVVDWDAASSLVTKMLGGRASSDAGPAAPAAPAAPGEEQPTEATSIHGVDMPDVSAFPEEGQKLVSEQWANVKAHIDVVEKAYRQQAVVRDVAERELEDIKRRRANERCRGNSEDRYGKEIKALEKQIKEAAAQEIVEKARFSLNMRYLQTFRDEIEKTRRSIK